MILLAEELFIALGAISTNTYFHLLPANANGANTYIIYELNDSASFDTLSRKNYANEVGLTVKVLNPDAKALMQLGEDIKAALLNRAFTNIHDVKFTNSVPIFPDPDLKSNQLTLLFTLYKSNA